MVNYFVKIYVNGEYKSNRYCDNYSHLKSYFEGCIKRYETAKFLSIAKETYYNGEEKYCIYLCDEKSIEMIQNECKLKSDELKPFVEISEDADEIITLIKKIRRTFKNSNISVEEVKNLIKLGESYTVVRIWNKKLIQLKNNLKQNDYSYESLRYFLDYLIQPEFCKNTMVKEECAKEVIDLIDYFTYDSWTIQKACEIITNKINNISVTYYRNSINKD